MPEGSGGFVRAEFQNDHSESTCISVKAWNSLQTWGGYTSSGGSDSEQDTRDWGRCPRRGHLRAKTYMHSDHHGCQRGVRSKSRKDVNQSRQREEGRIGEQTKKADRHKARKQRQRKASCNHDDFKKDSKQASIAVRYLKSVENSSFGKWTDIEKGKNVGDSVTLMSDDNMKSSSLIIKNTENMKKETDLLNTSIEKEIDNKEMDEMCEKAEDKLEKYEKEKSEPCIAQDKEIPETADSVVRMPKVDKERMNELMSRKKCTKIKKSQTAMLEKQKLKNGDDTTWNKMDTKKEDTEKENQVMKVTSDVQARNVDKSSMHEKLRVNMEQGKPGYTKNGPGYSQIDNKDVESLEIASEVENEETTLKAVLDPQTVHGEEKSDESKVVETLGFEVVSHDVEVAEPECTLNFEGGEKKPPYKSIHRELDTYNSVDETSCSFSESLDWQNSVFSQPYQCSMTTKSFLYGSSSYPEVYTAKYQDSNKYAEFLETFMYDREALWEHSKRMIFDIVDTKFGGDEQYSHSSENKIKNDLLSNMKAEENECKIDNDGNEKEKVPDRLQGEGSDFDTDSEQTDNNPVEDGTEKNVDNEQASINSVEECTDKIVESEEAVVNPVEDGTDKNAEREQASINTAEHGTDDVDGIVDIGTVLSADDYMEDINEVEESEMVDDKAPVKFLDAGDKDDHIKEHAVEKDMKLGTVDIEGFKTLAVTADMKDANVDAGRSKVENIQVNGSDCNYSECHKDGKLQKRNRQRKSQKDLKSDRMERRYVQENLDGNNCIEKKKKKTIPVKIPKQESTLACKRNWRGRGYSMFVCGSFGRRCSANTGGGKGGNMNGGQDPSSNNNENRNTGNRRNQGGNDRDSGDKNDKNNNNNGQNDGWKNLVSLTDPEDTPTRRLVDIRVPEDDYKRYKKKAGADVIRKHTKLEDYEWLAKISCVITDTQGPTICLIASLTDDEWHCVLEQLDMPEELSTEALNCSVCITVESLLKHYAHCSSGYNNCKMCVKMFSLICSHVAKCINSASAGMCEIRICNTIKLVAENNIVMHLKTLWFQVRKKLARILDNMEEDVVQQQVTASEEPKVRRTSKGLSSFSGPLQSIPEGTPLALTSTSRSGSRVLRRKRSSLAYVDEQGQTEGEADVEEQQEEVDSKHGLSPGRSSTLYSRAEIPDESDAIPTSSEDGSVESSASTSTEGSGQFGISAVATRFVSLPMGPPGQGEPYFPSFKDKPTGKKGIGEVVYSSVHQLVIVGSIWEKFKTKFQSEAKLAKHYTEEGVILSEFKSKLKIKGLRYQNDFQWVKITHLGNGMTGKCHLAMDFETEFKFCVKEIHISHYEKEEIELWSELDNPYIVQVYGAIRHGEKIYILQELIEGGCLTEAINVQRKLGRRLSQLTALRYFHQLLLVLKYLKSRNILHEDLKADNILLNKTSNSVSIKVADFGLARRCQGTVRSGTKPVGTQTQWSPEKAEARVGYGFAAEIWAAICVLVHMLSGQPPWLRRYESYKALIIVIVEKSPPMEDIPRNIHESIKDLIKQGFTVCQGQRPTAEQLLDHHAFKLLDETTAVTSINGTYSILESMHSEAHTNQIDFDPNADLREIYRNLKHESEVGAAGGDVGKKKRASIVNLHSQELPYYSNEYRVYSAGFGEERSKDEAGQSSSSFDQTTNGNKNVKRSESSKIEPSSLSEVVYSRTGLPSQPDNNVDPSTHIARFYEDVTGLAASPQPQLPLLMYDPNVASFENEKKDNESRESSIEQLSSGTVTDKLIPDFLKIGFALNSGDDSTEYKINSFGSRSNDNNDDKFLDNIDDNEALELVRDAYTVPTVVNTSIDQSPGSQLTSTKSSSSSVSEGRTQTEGANIEILDNTVRSKPAEVTQKQPRLSSVSFADDHLQSFNDDDLFRSGSPKDLGVSFVQQIILAGNPIKEQPRPSDSSRPQDLSLAPPMATHFLTNTARQAYGEQSLPATYRQGHTPNNPLKLPRSAPTNSTQTTAGGLPYMISTSTNPQQLNLPVSRANSSGNAAGGHIDVGRGYPAGRSPYSPQHGYNQFGQQQFRPQQMQNNYMHLPRNENRNQQQGIPRSVEGHIGGQGHQKYVPSSVGMHETYIRSEMQPEFTRAVDINQQFNRNTYDPISMPNQPRRVHQSPSQHQSLITSTQFNPYHTSTPRTEGNIYGARPKLTQVPRQLFPVSEDQQYAKRNTDLRINDPRQIYEQITKGQPNRMNPYSGYPMQPKTPILNPAINPRPPPPQEGQRLGLRLDIDRAQNPPEMQGQNYAQTAPVFSPPKTPSKKSPDFHRTLSQVPITSKRPSPQSGITSASSSKEDKMSTSASKSQFEEQDEAFRELSRTVEEALSHHSDHGPVFFGHYEDDIDEEIHHEVDDRYLDNPAESLAHVLDPELDSSITVTFRSAKNGKEFKMKFMPRHTKLSWEKLIKEDLDGFSRVPIATEFQLQRFCLKFVDGSIVDLESCLGNSDLMVLMTQATDSDPWWIEGGMIMK